MQRQLLYTISGVALAALTASAAEAKPRHVRAAAHHHYRYGSNHYRDGYARTRYGTATGADILYRQQRPSYENPYSVRPQYGYEEAPYDPSYYGYGTQVFRRTIQAAHEPGVTLELDPAAKETATGGPSGGLPSQSGGGR